MYIFQAYIYVTNHQHLFVSQITLHRRKTRNKINLIPNHILQYRKKKLKR